jgi:hypothetical protein
MLEIVIGLLFWGLGLVIGSFGIVQTLIIIRVGIPATIKFNRSGMIRDSGKIVRNYIISIIILSAIVVAAWILVRRFAIQNHYYSFLVGIGMTVLLGLSKSGANEANLKDFFEQNSNSFIRTDVECNDDSKD